MNRDNEEQQAAPQTFCGALQKEANCKSLVLSVLIYGCLAAVTWCRCANVTKIVINFATYPIKSEKLVSPCDDGYIYIPVAFMGMLYLVYLVECYHSPIRIDLLHAESQNSVLAKLTQLKFAQPTIWWKAISYHYVRRKRQITRYRNGDNYTTTQAYYERVNTHAATSFYFYDYCGVKDISKNLILDSKIPITKITLTKGFAFSNVRSATEFEEARSRFFAEQEFRDDYMEMREGLDLGYNFNPITLVAVLGKPWFTNTYIYWCLSALLLSWPLRLIIEYKTQYVDYQITKLFGINYDTPTTIQIRTSASQLSAPGSYMLAPSYSEALLMDPSTPATNDNQRTEENQGEVESEMVPSYSEALLYEIASGHDRFAVQAIVEDSYNHKETDDSCNDVNAISCACICHRRIVDSSQEQSKHTPENDFDATSLHSDKMNSNNNYIEGSNRQERLLTVSGSDEDHNKEVQQSNLCKNCLNGSLSSKKHFNIPTDLATGSHDGNILESSKCNGEKYMQINLKETNLQCPERVSVMRDISEPDLRTNLEFETVSTRFLRANGRSLENILENEESSMLHVRARSVEADTLILEKQRTKPLSPPYEFSLDTNKFQRPSKGAIPKRFEIRSRVTVNNVSDAVKSMPTSRTYFCLKSILKHNRRRYTLVTTEELQGLTRDYNDGRFDSNYKNFDNSLPAVSTGCLCCPATDNLFYRRERCINTSVTEENQTGKKGAQDKHDKKEKSRTLIFASPIQEIYPIDPFRGKDVVPSKNPPDYEDALNLPVLSRLRRSFADKESGIGSKPRYFGKQYRAKSVDCEAQFLKKNLPVSLPSYDSVTLNDTPILSLESENRSSSECNSVTTIKVSESFSHSHVCATDFRGPPRLTRSLTERRYRSESQRHGRSLRKSFTERSDGDHKTDGKRTNLNMETSL